MPSTVWEFRGKTDDLDKKLKSATQSLAYMSEEAKRVNATFAVCDAETLNFTQALGNMGTSAKTIRGQLSELTAAATEVGTRYRQLTAEEKASPYGQALRKSMETLNARVLETREALSATQRELGTFNGTAGSGAGIIGNISEKLGINVARLAQLASASAAATAALKVGKDAFSRNESGIDTWGESLQVAGGIYNTFLDTLNNGNWSNFFRNINAAITNSRSLYAALDNLGSLKANNALPIAIAENTLAKYRLLKQEGKNVDRQIRETEAILHGLRSDEVAAGKKAGVQGIRNEITSRYNSVAGVGQISYDSVTKAIQQITTRGQKYFDEQRRIYENLTKKGTRETLQAMPAAMGGGVQRSQAFDINSLSKADRQLYAFAKTITEGESSIQAYTSVITQAVNSERNAARDTYKYNRWAGAGAGGVRSSAAAPAQNSANDEYKTAQLMLAAVENLRDIFKSPAREKYESLQQQRGTLEGQLRNVEDPEVRARLMLELEKVSGRIQDLQMPDGMRVDASGIVIPLHFEIDEEAMKAQSANFDNMVKSGANASKNSKDTGKAWRAAASAIQQAGSAMQQINNPAAKVAGIVAEAVANIALGFAMATASPATTATGVFGWIAAATAGVATMAAMIASIKSATKFADGGIVGGNSLGGDRILTTRINSGEMVINRADQQRLWETIRGGGVGAQSITVEGTLRGEDIYISQKSYKTRTGKK